MSALTPAAQPTTSLLDQLLSDLHDLLARQGVHVGVGTLRVLVVVLAGFVALQLVLGAARVVLETGGFVVGVVRTQFERKFWQDPGKLSTALSCALLAAAYGLYGKEQTRPLSEALKSLGRNGPVHVLPLAIVTQAVLLGGFWIVFGLLVRVPVREVFEPFGALLKTVGFLLAAFAVSVGVLLVTRGDAAAALLVACGALVAAFGCLLVTVRVQRRRAARVGAAPPVAARLPAHVGRVLTYAMVGSALTALYSLGSRDPAVPGLLLFDAAVLGLVVLAACFGFRAYIRDAPVPPALPYLLDLSLAVSACAIASAHARHAQVTLGPVPPWAVVVGPPLVVTAMIFLVHLRRHLRSTPNWPLCLATALAGGLLVGPLQVALAG